MKLFIEPNEITKEMLESNVAYKYLFQRVETEIENGKLFLEDFPIHKMFVVDMDKKAIIETLFNGYTVKTDFGSFDEVSREVNSHITYISTIDENGKEYSSRDYFISEDRIFAEDMLEDFLSEEE